VKAAKRDRRLKTNKATQMTDESFAQLKDAMEDALAFERGERRDLKITRIQASRAAPHKKHLRLTPRLRRPM